MEINLWIEKGRKRQVRGARGTSKDAKALRSAIREARGERTDAEVLWCQDRLSPVLRMVTRVVLGAGSTIGVLLLVALAVVSPDAWPDLLLVLALVVGVGGGFVAVVWAFDVGLEVRADGRLVRSGWGGIKEFDLRAYQRVTVKEIRPDDVDQAFEWGD